MLLMAIHALIGRKSLVATVIMEPSPSLPASSSATLFPPDSRAQLLSEPDAVPSRAVPYVITPERRAMLNPSAS